MKTLYFVFIIITMVCEQVTECKLMKRNQALRKVSNHLKQPKTSKIIIDAFKGLSTEDIDFIKQLDNQFNKFGGNVLIKVQRENRTNVKNIKRTIDGNLGYGYQNPNDQQSGYSFSKPKYELYPYSQHDIPPSRDYRQSEHNLHYLRHYPQALVDSDPSYYQKQAEHTSVEIQQSHSYEIKQTDDGYKTVYNNDDNNEHTDQSAYNQAGSISGDTVPVIVLRIPGPTKYASHLQALLQQYLEIRAQQYLQVLQENDAKQQIYDHTQYRGQDDTSVGPISSYVHPQAYIATPMLIQPVTSLHFTPSLPDPYQQNHEPHIETGDGHIVATPSPASYYIQPNGDTHLGVINPVSYEYHNVHVGAQLHPQELRGDIVYGRPHHESVTEHKQSLTNENFPSDKHTQVIFKSTTAPPFHETQHQNTEIEHEQPQHPQYGTPAIQNHPTSVVYHNFEQYYNNPEPNYDQQSHDEQINEENPGYDSSTHMQHSNEEVIPITQRPAVLPHNYHAQLAQLANYDDTVGYEYQQSSYDENKFKRSSNRKRQSNRSRDDHNKKLKRVGQRMKSRMALLNEAEHTQE